MKICSIDVGIKNLAFCLFVKEENSDFFQIAKWDVINLSKQINTKCVEINCNKPAKFMKEMSCYCLKHSKKLNLLIPSMDLKSSFINKQNIKSLLEIADKYNIKYEKPIKKTNLIYLINEYIYNTCLEPVENINASKIDLVTIGRNIQYHFDEILKDDIETIDKVIIENQISPIANRMKTIQGMISQYFIMRNYNISIEFVSAMNKLKNLSTKDEKISYKDRKKLGIQKTLELITNDNRYNNWIQFFNNHSKRDDLSDSALQGIWYISTIFTKKD
jgi:hypothetical protein